MPDAGLHAYAGGVGTAHSCACGAEWPCPEGVAASEATLAAVVGRKATADPLGLRWKHDTPLWKGPTRPPLPESPPARETTSETGRYQSHEERKP